MNLEEIMKTLHHKDFGVSIKVYYDIDAPESWVFLGLSRAQIRADKLLISNDNDQVLIPWRSVTDVFEHYDHYGNHTIIIETDHTVVELIPA